MNRIGIAFGGLMIVMLAPSSALAWGSANRYGGSTEHVAGEGTEHTNRYGGSTDHAYGGGTEHSNVYGGSTEGKYGYGAEHTNAAGGVTEGKYGEGAYHAGPGAVPGYHPPAYPAYPAAPAAYHPYHPPVAVPYYTSTGCTRHYRLSHLGALVRARCGLGERQPLRRQHGAHGRRRHRTHQRLRHQHRARLRRRHRAYQRLRRHHGRQVRRRRLSRRPLRRDRLPSAWLRRRLLPSAGLLPVPPTGGGVHLPVLRLLRLRGCRWGRGRHGGGRGHRVVEHRCRHLERLLGGCRRRQREHGRRLQRRCCDRVRRRRGQHQLRDGRELRDAAARRHVHQQGRHHLLPERQYLVPAGLRRERRLLPRGARRRDDRGNTRPDGAALPHAAGWAAWWVRKRRNSSSRPWRRPHRRRSRWARRSPSKFRSRSRREATPSTSRTASSSSSSSLARDLPYCTLAPASPSSPRRLEPAHVRGPQRRLRRQSKRCRRSDGRRRPASSSLPTRHNPTR